MKLLGEEAVIPASAVGDEPFVSMVLPLFNGEQYLRECIAHIAALDYPISRRELLIVDGASTDASAGLARTLLDEYGLTGAVITNPARTISSNLNVGLDTASGPLLCRVDVKSRIPSTYLRDATELLATRPELSWVGGGTVALPSKPRTMALGIARAHNNPVVMGGAKYQYRRESGGADTVYLGVGRIDALRAVNGWGTDLLMNEDYDLCQRLGGADAVWFDDRLTVGWMAPANASTLLGRYQGFGRSKVKYWRTRGERPAPRQMALLGLPVPFLAVAAGLTRRGSVPTLLTIGTTGALGGLLAIDNAYGPTESATIAERLAAALVAAPLIGGGWLSGVFLEALFPEDQ